MAELPIMPLMTDALEGDTAGLSHERFGQYMRLLVRWWRDGCAPASAEHLQELCGIDANAFDKLKRFLTETPDGYVQKKLFSTYERQIERSQKAKDAARKRWQCDGNANASPNADANAMLSINHEPSSLSKDKQSVARKRATRLSEDFSKPDDWNDYALKGGLTQAETDLLFEEMKTWSLTKKQGTSLDWKRTWQTWCRRHKSWGVKIKVDGTPTHSIAWPFDQEAREKAQALHKRIGAAAYASYFAQTPPLKNCEGWIIPAQFPALEQKLETQYGGAFNEIYGKGNWRFEPAA